MLVSKKDGTIRFCIDYRDLNSELKTQDTPIPLTVEAIDRLASGQGETDSLFLSALDLASGFWTLPIKESDKQLTAFVTHRQKYEFNYLPFGVQSGPSYCCSFDCAFGSHKIGFCEMRYKLRARQGVSQARSSIQ